MANYFTILTTTGKGLVAQSIASGTPINLTQVAVGDGSYTPNEGQTSLVSEQWRSLINQISRPDDNPNWVVIEAVIPPEDGGWYVREVGVFDANGDLFAIAKYPESYKPVLDEGSGKDLYIKMILEVSNNATVTLQIDPAIVLATRKYVDDENESQTVSLLDALHNHRHTGRTSVDDGAIDYAVATGSDNAYAITLSPALDAHIAGMPIVFKANHDNTGATTLNVNDLGDVSIAKKGGMVLEEGDIVTGQLVIVVYDGTHYQLVSKAASTNELVSNLKPVVDTSVNILDIFTKSGGAAPDSSNIITVAIPDGNGYTFRSRAAAYLSGTSQIVMADAANYWSKGSLDGDLKDAYLYAIWEGTGIVWALGGRSDLTNVSTATTVTDDDYLLLEDDSTYTRSASHFCVCVGRISYEYDTDDDPDHTIQAAIHVAWGVDPVDLSKYARSHAASGYQMLPGGLIIQWGVNAHSSGSELLSIAVTYPITFPNAVYAVTSTQRTAAGTEADDVFMEISGNGYTTSGCTLKVRDRVGGSIAAGEAHWIAIGK